MGGDAAEHDVLLTSNLAGYTPQRVRERVATTQSVAQAPKRRISANRLFKTPVTAQIRAEDVLELAMERAGIAPRGPRRHQPCSPARTC